MRLRTRFREHSTTRKITIGVFVTFFMIFQGLHFLPVRDYSVSEDTRAVILPKVQDQQEIDTEILSSIRSSTYPFTNPLVIQDPYGVAPLTALLIFDTAEPAQITVHVPGKTPQASVDFTFQGFSTHHELPIYGLYAGITNPVTLSQTNRAGKSSQTTVALTTEPLPLYLETIKVLYADPAAYSPGMNFSFLDHKQVFDINGDIRWFSTLSTYQTFSQLKNGHYLFTYLVPRAPNDVVMEQDLLGKIYAVYNIPNGVHHDFAELPNGNLLVTSEDSASHTVEDVMVEIDRQSGQVVRKVDFKQILDPARKPEIKSVTEDWLHLNSIAYDAADNSVIISSRAQSAVIKLSYPGMKIQWILGPHDNWKAPFQPFLLTPLGEDFEWAWSQHHATILSEGTLRGTRYIDLLLFDNGLYRSFDPNTALSPVDSYSRMVQYRIDETRKTVTQVWEYGKERGSDIFSASRGSAYRLANGDYLGEWAEIDKDAYGLAVIDEKDKKTVSSRTIEVSSSDQQVVFEAAIPNATNYRTFRAGLYDGVSIQDSLISGKVNDTTAMTIRKEAIMALQPAKKGLSSVETQVKTGLKHFLQKIGIWPEG